ncbi:hypothetical protein [Pseudoalteromonas sp.]|uniref:hypothetical protein n=1 Tax=Pseudoalteromonas sp. TaxID=53249 RepID=UPI0035677A43
MSTLLSNISVRNKINILSGALLSVLISFAAFEIHKLSTIKINFETYTAVAVALEVTTLKINRDINYVSRLNRSIMLSDNYQENLGNMRNRIKSIETLFNNLESVIERAPSIDNKLAQMVSQSKKSTKHFLNESLLLVQTLSSNSSSE